MTGPAKTAAGKLAAKDAAWTDIVMEISRPHHVAESMMAPAVAEPLIAWVVSGSAMLEEREFGGLWSGRVVQAGEFFLATSPTPYEFRWLGVGHDPSLTCQMYIGLPFFARATKEVTGIEGVPAFREVFGERDATLTALLEVLRGELTSPSAASAAFVQGIAQSIAIHLVRAYADPNGSPRSPCPELPACRLREITGLLEAHLDQELPLARLADEAGMNELHFSRLFKRTTGFSPSQYLIRLRMERARLLLRETSRSVIEIGLAVGYSRSSHFTQVFRREVGVSPTEYRGRE